MHQSSLGGLMIVAGPKLHPLWHTPLLPLLALVSCLSMGLGAVVVLTALMRHAWNAKHDHDLLVDVSRVNGGLLILFAGLRFADLASSGKLELLTVPDFFLIFFVLEMALFLVPAFMFLTRRVEDQRVRVLGGALAVLSGALWRVDAFLTCYNAGESFRYWPSWGEISVTVGMAAIGVALFITVSRLLPVVVVQDTPVPASLAAFVLSGMPRRDRAGPGKKSAGEGRSAEPTG